MFYFVRCICGSYQLAISYRGALDQLKLSGPDAAIYSLTGKWLAGRRIIGAQPC